MVKKVEIDQHLPDFEAPATGDKIVKLSELKGKHVVLYFYPKDATPGCTQEGQDFRDQFLKFRRRKTLIFGISRDNLKSHEKFKTRHAFPFDLIADENEHLCQLFDVIKMKNMYGKKVRGIVRSTFLIDCHGVLRQEWRAVKVAGHVDEVLEAISTLSR